MQQQLEQLEAELTLLQIELRQVRQMIGSLIRTQEDTWALMAQQQPSGHNSHPQQTPPMQGSAYHQLRQVAEDMNAHLHQFAEALHPGQMGRPNANLYHNPMAPRHNDPMQNQY